jgi:hypothetical protein
MVKRSNMLMAIPGATPPGFYTPKSVSPVAFPALQEKDS